MRQGLVDTLRLWPRSPSSIKQLPHPACHMQATCPSLPAPQAGGVHAAGSASTLDGNSSSASNGGAGGHSRFDSLAWGGGGGSLRAARLAGAGRPLRTASGEADRSASASQLPPLPPPRSRSASAQVLPAAGFKDTFSEGTGSGPYLVQVSAAVSGLLTRTHRLYVDSDSF